MDKEKYSFLNPKGIETFAFIFSGNALQWLHGTTTDDNGRKIGNFTLFGDLLARMALADGTAKGFYRPLTLSGAVFRRTAFNTMEHGQEAHPPPVGRTGKTGTHRHLPFKGCVRDDFSMPPAMDDKGWQRSF